MQIRIDKAIRKKWHSGFERHKPIKNIVIHGTGGGSTYNYVLNGGRKELYVRGIALFHYLIERNGEIIEITDPNRWVYHSSSGGHDEQTIGIELVNYNRSNNAPYTQKQYKALFFLIKKLLNNYPTIDVILSHRRAKQKYSGGTKNCPGKFFNWQQVRNFLDEIEYNYKYDTKYESIWSIEPC